MMGASFSNFFAKKDLMRVVVFGCSWGAGLTRSLKRIIIHPFKSKEQVWIFVRSGHIRSK